MDLIFESIFSISDIDVTEFLEKPILRHIPTCTKNANPNLKRMNDDVRKSKLLKSGE